MPALETLRDLPTSLPSAISGERILVVDEDPEVRSHVAASLRQSGFDVETVAEGRACIASLKRSPPALVLSDIVLPDINGLELVRRIRSELAMATLPVVLMSGAVDRTSRVAAFDAGANDFVSKPLDVDELIARVRERLRTAKLLTQLLSQTVTDPLTGLLNRRGVMQLLDREISRCARTPAPISVLLIDIDRFKQINDTYGHATGDTALCTVADELAGAVRGSDIVGRIGGDEFVAVLTGTCAENATAVAGRLKRLVESKGIADTGQKISVSVGIAYAKRATTTSAALLELADRNMYSDKRGVVIPWSSKARAKQREAEGLPQRGAVVQNLRN